MFKWEITEDVQAFLQISDRNAPCLAITALQIDACRLKIEIPSSLKRKPSFAEIAFIFLRVELNLHSLIVHTI